jgi:hypothetical protein
MACESGYFRCPTSFWAANPDSCRSQNMAKTRAPRSQTPVHRHRYRRDKIPVIPGIAVSPNGPPGPRSNSTSKTSGRKRRACSSAICCDTCRGRPLRSWTTLKLTSGSHRANSARNIPVSTSSISPLARGNSTRMRESGRWPSGNWPSIGRSVSRSEPRTLRVARPSGRVTLHTTDPVVHWCGEIGSGPVKRFLRLLRCFSRQPHAALVRSAGFRVPDVFRFQREAVQIREQGWIAEPAGNRIAWQSPQPMSKASLTYSSGVAFTNTAPKTNISAGILDGSTFATAVQRLIVAIRLSVNPVSRLRKVRSSGVVIPARTSAPEKPTPASIAVLR